MSDQFDSRTGFEPRQPTIGLPRIGTVFAGYGLEGVLGRGGMSVVYRADNPRLGNKVALKVLAAELSEDDAFRERFVRESRVAASISHPNVLPIYDAGDSDGLLYIVMRYIEGSDLKALLHRDGPLPVQRACALICQAGGALHAAHERGLIHRDVKPGNMLIERIDEGIQVLEHVYLADFGLTKHAQSRSGLTHTGVFVGTVDYVAPEQIEGRPVDRRADVYSLGCVLYECLTGVVPYHRETDVAVLWAHVQEPCPPVESLRADLPEGMNEIVARAMAKAPEERYQTAAELVEELRRISREAGSRLAAGDVVSTGAGGEPVASRPAGANAAAAGSRPPSQPPGALGGPAAEAAEPVASMPPRAKRSMVAVLSVVAIVIALAVGGVYLLSRGSHSAAPPASGSQSGAGTTAGGTTSAATAFPANTAALQRVMDHRLLGNGQCRDTQGSQPPVPGVPATIAATAVEGVQCTAAKIGFPTVQYAVFLYPDTNTLDAAFHSVLQGWSATGQWHSSSDACHASGVWSGGPTAWLHPSESPPAPGHLGGYRACFNHQPLTLMVWSHLRDNPTPQPDHYNTLVAVRSTNTGPGESLPTDLKNFWLFVRKHAATPIGKSLTGGNLPPLQ